MKKCLIILFLVLGALELYMAYGERAEGFFSVAAPEREYAYQIGEKLSFREDATANPYCIEGFSLNEGTHTWTSGKFAKMCFDLTGEYKNLVMKFSCRVYAPPQRVEVYVNGYKLTSFVASKSKKHSIYIPAKYILKDRLRIEFILPDAVSPAEMEGVSDTRLLALGMLNLRISSIQ